MFVVTALAATVAAAQPLTPAVTFRGELEASPAGIARMRAAGVQTVRLNLAWVSIAPKTRPEQFDPADPADPAYSWESFDRQVSAAVAAGLEPIVGIVGAPAWAEKEVPKPYYGSIKPSASELALFARAAARRYGGGFEGLPRVRNWMLWNEPNLIFWLQPQFEHGRPYSPGLYRKMLNAFADAVHGVHADNVVIAGGTAPFTSADGTTAKWGVAPLAFMRTVLCLGPQPPAGLLGTREVRRLGAPPVYVGRAHAPCQLPRRRVARRPPEDESRPRRRRAHAQDRGAPPRALLGDGVQLGHEPARSRGDSARSAVAVGFGGDVHDVAERRQPRHVVHTRRLAVSRLGVPVGAVLRRRQAEADANGVPFPVRRAAGEQPPAALGTNADRKARPRRRSRSRGARGDASRCCAPTGTASST